MKNVKFAAILATVLSSAFLTGCASTPAPADPAYAAALSQCRFDAKFGDTIKPAGVVSYDRKEFNDGTLLVNVTSDISLASREAFKAQVNKCMTKYENEAYFAAKDAAGDKKPLSMMPVTFQTTSLTAGKSR